MGLNEEVAILSRIPLFSKIGTAQLKLIAFASHRIVFQDGEDICRQGEAGDRAYILVSGTGDVYVETAQETRKISTVQTHEIVGEVAVLADVPRTATVRADGEVVALELKKDVLIRVMQDFPDVAIEITRLIAWRLHNMTIQIEAFTPQNTDNLDDDP